MLMLSLAAVIPRVIVGLIFAGHGAQKLLGWFGGHGLPGTAALFRRIGLEPAVPWAVVAGLIETLGGLALALGLATPIAAIALTAVMFAATFFVHAPRGFWAAAGGYEYPLVLIGICSLFGFAGAGPYSLDAYWNLTYPIPDLYVVGFAVALVVAVALRLVVAWRTSERQASSQAA
jgi:putative oxidoreductase